MKRFEIYSVNLDPTLGVEMQKTRPCLIISPDEMNRHLHSIIVAPLTSQFRAIPSRVHIAADVSNGLTTDSYIALDQIKAIDKSRCIRLLGSLSDAKAIQVSNFLVEMFRY